jgi:hypothetical protein
LADKFTLSLENMGINNCLLQVSDGYTNEEEPHYQLNASFGNGDANFLRKVYLSISYSATDGKEDFDGLIKIVVSLRSDSINTCKTLETEAFNQYNELMEEIYPEWKTDYDQAGIQFAEFSD